SPFSSQKLMSISRHIVVAVVRCSCALAWSPVRSQTSRGPPRPFTGSGPSDFTWMTPRQAEGVGGHQDGARVGQLLHARGQLRRLADGRVLHGHRRGGQAAQDRGGSGRRGGACRGHQRAPARCGMDLGVPAYDCPGPALLPDATRYNERVSGVQLLILAVIQGLTELLPVSSSAHVILAERLMGLDPAAPDLTFLLVMLHTGTMLAVLAYFGPRWRRRWRAE